MEIAAVERPTRRPRFRRASEPPAFRLTDDDVEIVRQVARYRLIRSTHIAALIGRSLDRTNDRLLRLFHAGYVDRPRAQLDYYPTAGSGPMVYALADRGVRLLRERDGADFRHEEWGRKNREAGRPGLSTTIEPAFDPKVSIRSRRKLRTSRRKPSMRSSSRADALWSLAGNVREACEPLALRHPSSVAPVRVRPNW